MIRGNAMIEGTTTAPLSDPLVDVAIRDGHRQLLDAYREFLPVLVDGAGSADEMRAAVEFLRSGVGSFARWEDGQLANGHPVSEDSAFEHAFLAAETEGLARSVTRFLGGNRGALAEMRRFAYRIEASLELHVYKGEDRPLLALASMSPPVRVPATVGMEEDEIDAALSTHYWAVLGTQGEAGPYAVPVSYGFRDGAIYLAMGPGRKRSNLERAPVAVLTMVDVRTPHDWVSVVVEGGISRVTRRSEWSRAVRAIHRQRALAGPLRTEELRRVLSATLFRLDPRQRGGRRCGSCEP